MRNLWLLMLIPLAGCAMDDGYLAPPPPMPVGSSCAPPVAPVANSCSAPYRPVAYSSPMPQTQEPPR